MGIIAKTFTRGFRTSFFRNQPVHQFYGHLQAVLREISPAGELDNLFARPEISADGQQMPAEIEWSTALEGEKVMFKDLSPEKQQEAAASISSALEKIKKYAEDKQHKSGKEKDYAEYLKAVAVSPDVNQIFVVKRQPVLVHWGLICENGSHPGQGMYAGWDEFIAEIHRKAESRAKEPERIVLPPEPPPEPVPVKEVEKKKPAVASAASNAAAATGAAAEKTAPVSAARKTDEKKQKAVVACGLGDYEWVKWLAIILAIIILLLLLLRLLPPPHQAMPQMPPGMSMPGGGGGGSGGGSGGGGGGNGGGGGGQGGGGKAPAPGQPCPTCGHAVPDAAHSPTQPQQGATPQPQSQQGSAQHSQPVQQSAPLTQPNDAAQSQTQPAAPVQPGNAEALPTAP